ncbi:MAG: methyltransferase domain-containing protein [Dokdonella sp.]
MLGIAPTGSFVQAVHFAKNRHTKTMSENRWASGRFPSNYRQDVNESIAFSGLDLDMFARGKAADLLDLLRVESSIPAMQATCLDIGCGIGVSHPLIVDDVGSLVGVDVSVDAIEIAREANAKVEYRVQHETRSRSIRNDLISAARFASCTMCHPINGPRLSLKPGG